MCPAVKKSSHADKMAVTSQEAMIGHPLTAHSILDTIIFYQEFHRNEDVAFFGHG